MNHSIIEVVGHTGDLFEACTCQIDYTSVENGELRVHEVEDCPATDARLPREVGEGGDV